MFAVQATGNSHIKLVFNFVGFMPKIYGFNVVDIFVVGSMHKIYGFNVVEILEELPWMHSSAMNLYVSSHLSIVTLSSNIWQRCNDGLLHI